MRTFSGSYQSPTVTNAPSSSLVTRTGTFSAYAYSPTLYSFTYTIRDTDAYEWTNGSISPLTYTWRMNQKVFTKPVQSGVITYNGNEQRGLGFRQHKFNFHNRRQSYRSWNLHRYFPLERHSKL